MSFACWPRGVVRGAMALAATFCGIGLVQPSQAATPIPAEAFFKRPSMHGPALSPSGRWLAVLTSVQKSRGGILVIDLEGKEQNKFIEASTAADVNWIQWLGEDWMLFTVDDPDSRAALSRGNGLMAVRRDGSDSRMLIQREWEDEDTFQRKRTLSPAHFYAGLGAPGSSDIIIGEVKFDTQWQYSHDYYKVLNVATMGVRSLYQDGPRAQGLLTDGTGKARALIDTREGQTSVYWSDTGDAPWKQIGKTPTLEQTFALAYVDSDDKLVVSVEGREGGELRRFDLATGKPGKEVILATPGFSLEATPIRQRGERRLLGLSFWTDARGVVWFDPALQALQDKVDAKLPGRINLIACAPCANAKVVVVESFSDGQPGQIVLWRPQEDKWQLLGEERPDIDPARMAVMEFHRTKARDGRDLPVWVTKPAGAAKSPMPTVVMPHGGPYVRGNYWRWHADAQFLASRGYVVIEPEFRGSDGFGYQHFRAGWKQWGLAMQDDVTDALKFAVAQGWTDPKKVCIVGSSYGGYSALMGLVKDPELYRCGVAHAAVTDIRNMFDMHWSDLSSEFRRYGFPALLGNRKTDEARFIATSPQEQAGRIQAPVLLVHGKRDRRVPIENGERMHDALKRAGKSVEWVVYPDEGHGFRRTENEVDFWTRVEKFLAQHLR